MKMHAALFVIAASCGAALLCAQPAEEKPVWHGDWPTAQRSARQEGKPIFAVLVCRH